MLSPLYFYLRHIKKVKNHTKRKISRISRSKNQICIDFLIKTTKIGLFYLILRTIIGFLLV